MWTRKNERSGNAVPSISAPIGPPVSISFNDANSQFSIPFGRNEASIRESRSAKEKPEKGVGIKKRIMQLSARVHGHGFDAVSEGPNLTSKELSQLEQTKNRLFPSRAATATPPICTTNRSVSQLSMSSQPSAAINFENDAAIHTDSVSNIEREISFTPSHREDNEQNELCKKVEALKTANSELRSAKAKVEDQLMELQKNFQNEHQTSQRLSTNLDQESRERERLKAEIRHLQQQLLQQKAAFSISVQDDYNDRRSNGETEAEFNKKTCELEAVRDEIAKLKEQELSLILKNEKTTEQLLDIQAETSNLRARNEHLEKRQKDFNNEMKLVREQLEDVKEQKSQLEKRCSELVGSVKDRDSQIQTLKAENTELRASLNKTRSELDEILDANLGKPAASIASNDEELTAARNAKRNLEAKLTEIENELEDAVLRNQSFEQKTARLETTIERLRNDLQREADGKETEISELRAQFQRRIRTFEDEINELSEANSSLLKQNRILESRARQMDTQSQASSVDMGGSSLYYKRELRKALALLRDAQAVLAHERESAPNNTIVRQLKEQLEDAENAKLASLRTRHALENELSDLRNQFDMVNAAKCTAEEKVLAVMRDKNAANALAQEHDDQLQELLKKHKAHIQQAHLDSLTLAEQMEQIANLERANQKLQEQLNEAAVNIEFNKLHTVDKHKVQLLQLKLRDLQAKLDLETSQKIRLESITAKLKDEIEYLQEQILEAKSARDRESDAFWKSKKEQKMLQEEINDLKKRESDLLHRYKATKIAGDLLTEQHNKTQADLRVALKRIDALQATLNAELTAGSDIEEEDEHDDERERDEEFGEEDGDISNGKSALALGETNVRPSALLTDDERNGRGSE